jgi:hypothetical protein
MRRLVLLIFILGVLGTGAELLLLQHYDGAWQAIPLALMAAALLVLVWHGTSRGAASIHALRVVMGLFLGSGLIGLGLHYNANAEFEREMDPSLSGMGLFTEALSGATPALAPGTMVQLGLLGLVYTYRHPRLTAAAEHELRRNAWDA